MTTARCVLYVGNFTRPWCTEVHVQASLAGLGHRVVPLQENSLRWADVPRLADEHGADLLLWTRTWDVDRDEALAALDRLRAMGVRTASFHLDRWLGLDREYQLDVEPFFRTDDVFTADGTDPEAWARRGIRHHWLPPGVLAAEARLDVPRARHGRHYRHQVVFVGSHPYPHPAWRDVRAALIDGFARHYGRHFAVWPPTNARRPIRGRELGALYQSAKVVLGDSCLIPPVARYWSDRVPETLGRGGCLIHPWVEGLADWYPDLPTFPVGDVDGAIAHADKLLYDDTLRADLVARQRQLVLSRDTYAHRMQTVLATVGLA